VRTEQMHRIAESGVASHWIYKDDTDKLSELQKQTHRWLQRCSKSSTSRAIRRSFLEHVKVDLFPDEVYVFTPGQDPLAARGATAVDFAYVVHTDIGNRCVAAKVTASWSRCAPSSGTATASRSSRQPRQAQPGMRAVRAHGQGALQHPPLPEDHAVRGVGRSRRAAARFRPIKALNGSLARSTTPAGSASCATAAPARARSCLPISASASACRRW